jgi:Mrp family chromosome partitioning ATPase
MRLGRRRPPVLAEISGESPAGAGPGALRRGDMDAYGELLRRLDGSSAVLVTGEDEDAGNAALGLATTAAAAGRRTALVECDLARPRLADGLGLAAAPGLGEYLRGEAEEQAILRPVVLTGPGSADAGDPLVCVVAGRSAGDAGSLLASDGLRRMLAGICAAYEFAVIAGPSLRHSGSLSLLRDQADVAIACVARPRPLSSLPLPVAGLVILR